jgi:hypothetical protein
MPCAFKLLMCKRDVQEDVQTRCANKMCKRDVQTRCANETRRANETRCANEMQEA